MTTRERKGAIYVDELRPIRERRDELIAILTSSHIVKGNIKHYLVYGLSGTEANQRVNKAIRGLNRRGITIKFEH